MREGLRGMGGLVSTRAVDGDDTCWVDGMGSVGLADPTTSRAYIAKKTRIVKKMATNKIR